MRTTIRLKGDLLDMAKAKAAAQGRTLTAFIEDAVRAELAAKPETRERIELPVFHGGGGVPPSVDINKMGEVLDLMDELEPR